MEDLRHLVRSGAQIAVRVTPKGSRNALVPTDEGLRAYVTVAPENGKANAAVAKLLAKSMGIASSRLTLIRGAGARDKLFQID